MKLLLFSDIHCSLEHCKELVQKSASVDIVIGAGDIGLVRKGLRKTIEALKDIKKPIILVPGNSESQEELENVCQNWEQAIVLHGNGIELSGMKFYGVGGGIPVTPFGDWSYDFTEQEAAQLLSDCQHSNILITHSPPKGAVDISATGQSFGSQAIREAIIEKNPILCVCGHIHESAGNHAKIVNTTVVNAGPDGILWEI